jgi:hypothetical protein
MPAKAIPKKNETAQKTEAPKAQPKKAPVATAPENKAHHATLSGTKCSDCAVGLLKQHASESLRNQKKVDPGNQKYHLQDNEEIELVRTNPLTLQLVGLRRERSLSNRFDDLLVVLYNPPLIKEGEKTVLEAEGLRKENLESAQAYVNAILAAKGPGPQKDWPIPGADVSCQQCKHWRVLVYPITTEPGYDKSKPSIKDDKGNKLPDFDNHTLLPLDVGAVAPGIYNNHYRVGLHKGSVNPPTSFAALQLAVGSIPARRRYPIADFLKASQAAYDKNTDDELRKALISKDAKAQKELRAKIEAELAKTLPKKTNAEKAAFDKAVKAKLDAENLEAYKPKIAEHRKKAAKDTLTALKGKIAASERFIRLESPSGAETQNFETAGNEVSHLEVADDDKAPMKVCVQLVFKAAPAPAATIPAATTPPPAPKVLKLTQDDILVTFGTAAGTNMHRSVNGESGAWVRDREVNNWSEGCQVFRSPHDFAHFMRLAMLSKRALCPSRKAACSEKLTVEDVEKGIGANMTAYLKKCPKEFAMEANDALLNAFPPTPPKPATPDLKTTTADPQAAAAPDLKVRTGIEKLVDASKAYKEFDGTVRSTFRQVFTKAYEKEETVTLMKSHAREKVLTALMAVDPVKKAAEAGSTDPKSVEEDVKKAIDPAIEDLRKKLTETKDAWIKDLQPKLIQKKHLDFVGEGLEPCDFGGCGFKFDYMLAETTRANMEAFVSKLGDRDWNSLFPEDAPQPPPPKQAKPK